MVSFYNKYDYEPGVVKENVSGESHTIPNSAPYDIYLKHIPVTDSVNITGMTPVTSDPDASGEYRVFYDEALGRIKFHSSNANGTVSVDYDACGTVVWAEDYSDGREGINKIQTNVQSHVNGSSPHTGHAKTSGDTFTGDVTLADGALLRKSDGVSTYDIITDDGKVHRPTFVDIAEFHYKLEEVGAGDVLVGDFVNGKIGVKKSKKKLSRGVVGVVSDTYGYILGGDKPTEKENLKTHAPIGLAGFVKVNAVGPIDKYDILVSSDIGGYAMSLDRNKEGDYFPLGCVVGKAFENVEKGVKRRIWMLIMNC